MFFQQLLRTFFAAQDGKAQARRVDVPMSIDESNAEDRFGHEVQASIEKRFIVWRYNVASFAQTPCDWVKQPDEQCQDTTDGEGPVHIIAKTFCVCASNDGKLVKYTDHGSATRSIEACSTPSESVLREIVLPRPTDPTCIESSSALRRDQSRP